MKRVLCFVLLVLAAVTPLRAATSLTVMPSAFQTVLDNSGNPINGGKVCTYVAGTTTPIATYTDSTGATPNRNPIVADGSGRFTAWLIPGTSYKFVYQDASGTFGTCDGVTFYTVDNVGAIPGSAGGVDVTGTAGEALTAGQAVYLSAGDAGKTAGLWYKADNSATYSSTLHIVGVVPSSIAIAATGAIRISGSVTGLSSLSVGANYFVGTAGALTSTAPANARFIGQADSSTSLVVGPPTASVAPVIQTCGRLTLTTAVPITASDVTAAVSVFYTPLSGCNQVTVWTGAALVTDTLTELTLAVPATTSTMYDVFARDNAGVIAVEALAWTNDTTRATAITVQNGFLAKSGDATRRYVGSFRTTAVSGQTEDSAVKRYVWNYYNRARRPVLRLEATDTWPYSSAAYQQANASTANQIDIVVGFQEAMLSLRVVGAATNGSGVLTGQSVAIGEDSTTTAVAGLLMSRGTNTPDATVVFRNPSASLDRMPAIGRHFYAWLESATASGTTTWYGDGGTATIVQSGISGWWES